MAPATAVRAITLFLVRTTVRTLRALRRRANSSDTSYASSIFQCVCFFQTYNVCVFEPFQLTSLPVPRTMSNGCAECLSLSSPCSVMSSFESMAKTFRIRPFTSTCQTWSPLTAFDHMMPASSGWSPFSASTFDATTTVFAASHQ